MNRDIKRSVLEAFARFGIERYSKRAVGNVLLKFYILSFRLPCCLWSPRRKPIQPVFKMSIIPAGVPANFNATLLNNTDLCTFQTCPLALAHVNYVPNLGGNALYAAIFGLAMTAQISLTIKHRGTWGYGVAMFGGLILEIIGYVARIQMHANPFKSNPFLM